MHSTADPSERTSDFHCCGTGPPCKGASTCADCTDRSYSYTAGRRYSTPLSGVVEVYPQAARCLPTPSALDPQHLLSHVMAIHRGLCGCICRFHGLSRAVLVPVPHVPRAAQADKPLSLPFHDFCDGPLCGLRSAFSATRKNATAAECSL